MDLSVLIPTYNAYDKVLKCLRSVTEQCTSYSYEIICFDDGSNDDSKLFLENAKKDFINVRFLCSGHIGVASARNTLLDQALGNYVMFVDADDILVPRSIDHLMDAAIRYHADLVEGSYTVGDSVYSLCEEEIVFYRDRDKLYLSGFLWGKVIRRSLFDSVRFYDGHYYEDLVVHTVILPLTKICVYTPHICYHYRRTESGLSITLRNSENLMDSVYTLDYYLEMAARLSVSLGQYHKLFFQYYSGYICTKRFQNCPIEKKKLCKEALSKIAKKLWQNDAYNRFEQDIIDASVRRHTFINPIIVKRFFENNNENCIPIVLATDKTYLPVLPVLIRSLLMYNVSNTVYDIIIFHDHLQEQFYLHILEEFVSDTVSIRFIDIHKWTEDIEFGISNNNKLNETTYFRLLIPFILSTDYHKAIYLDCDMVVQTDLRELFSIQLKHHYVAAVQDITGLAEYYAPSNSKRQYRDKMFPNIFPQDYFNAGLLLIDLDSFRQNISFSFIREMMEQTCWNQYDQDILNFICAGKTLMLPLEWNVIADFGLNQYLPDTIRKHAKIAELSPKIIHYGGGNRKPWKRRKVPYFDIFWIIAKKTNAYERLCDMLQENETYNN